MAPNNSQASGASGGLIEIDGRPWYRVDAVGSMPPFLMSVVSESDVWLFVSSAGGMTAGRGSPERCVFPYETDDRLHLDGSGAGPLTMVRVRRGSGEPELWRPFHGRDRRADRWLAKSVAGHAVVVEERREDLGLTVRSRLATSREFGVVRTVTLRADAPTRIDLLDGLINVMPAGVELLTQQRASTLVDAYKRTELLEESPIAVYCLEASISDQPRPSESLRANVAWRIGPRPDGIALGVDAVERFERGEGIGCEARRTGVRGAYLVESAHELAAGEELTWSVVVDADYAQERVVELRRRVAGGASIEDEIEASIERGARRLEELVARADGMQRTGDAVASVHHQSNTLFNCLRGGVPEDARTARGPWVREFVGRHNRDAAARHRDLLEGLPDRVEREELMERVSATGDADLARIVGSCLPLMFSRRHGDPSRPWNRFDIRVEGDDGEPLLRYEGNWRDIFQNWEALGASFPRLIESFVWMFLNATTADGFNPYRISDDGIDWEAPDPDDPWANIGYWGDHQVIYLLRLLEALDAHEPEALEGLLRSRSFVFADVPYRIAGFDALLRDPKHTIDYDHAHAGRIDERVAAIGADGRLVHDASGGLVRATLIEKLLIVALNKLSNLAPEGGIWLNTQRPEWNDANNALVGNGLSVVTTCALRRYLVFVLGLLERTDGEGTVELEASLSAWFGETLSALTRGLGTIEGPSSDPAERLDLLERLGRGFAAYRERVYDGALGGVEERPRREVEDLLRLAIHHVDNTIDANRRSDGLYTSYNLLVVSGGGREAHIDRLGEMLEGQVSALSSGRLGPGEAIELVDRLFASPMYRADQKTFMLYPIATRAPYLQRNVLPREAVSKVGLLLDLLAAGDGSVVVSDADGACRFSSDFRSAEDLDAALDRLAERRPDLAERIGADRAAVLGLYEDVFRHRSFQGRSGTMHKYEGIGCVYWHMVSKLLLSIQEIHSTGAEAGEDAGLLSRLARCYYEVREGLGFNKSPEEHGAIPIEPYSHTPLHVGAQQPGMTGQVKEAVLIRLGELGVTVREGRAAFRPRLLRGSELLDEPVAWDLRDGRTVELAAGSLGFSYCGVPVVYTVGGASGVVVTRAGGERVSFDGDSLDAETSSALFDRAGAIERIDVTLAAGVLLDG